MRMSTSPTFNGDVFFFICVMSAWALKVLYILKAPDFFLFRSTKMSMRYMYSYTRKQAPGIYKNYAE